MIWESVKVMSKLACILTVCIMMAGCPEEDAQTTTPNLGLSVPAINSSGWGTAVNDDLVLIDSAANTYRGVWSSSTTYTAGQYVMFGGAIYISTIAANIANTPSSGTGWIIFGSQASVGSIAVALANGFSGTVAGMNPATITLAVDSTHYLPTTTDQTNWNANQPAGNYITALTGDVTASGPGSAVSTLAATGNVQGIIRANRLDQFAAPVGPVAFGGQKITGLANGSASTDAAAFGQIPTTFPASAITGSTLPSGITSAPGLPFIPTTQRAAANGVATLNASTLIPVAQLPLGTSSAPGAVQCDGTTITCTSGVITSVSGAGVSSINGTAGHFTFSGSGVSCATTTCTFSGSGSGIGSITWAIPSWLSASPTTLSASGIQTFSPASGQTSHQVIGTCGTASSFAPCVLVAGDIPALPYLSSATVLPVTKSAVSSQWINSYTSGTGAFTSSQPAFTDISGTIGAAQLPLATTMLVGGVKCDGTTITCTSGVIAAVGGAVSSVFGRTGAVTATSGDYTVSQVTGAAPLASPALTGTPTAPTQIAGDNTTKLATTSFVQTAITSAQTILSGTTGTITNSALTSSCESVTTSVTGATVGSPVPVSTSNGATPWPYQVQGRISTAGSVIVEVCGTGTPTFTTFNFSVIQ